MSVSWRNRIVGHVEIPATDLKANPRNWRTHPDAQTGALNGVLVDVGWVQSVIVNQRSGFIVDGHARVKMAAERGESVPVVYVDLSDEEEALILASLDPLSAMAGVDPDLLANLLAEVPATDSAELQALLSGLEIENAAVKPGLTDEDDAPEVQPVSITVVGDLWLLGAHRVLCGDSTSSEAVARLMAGEKADMMFTDPPYGVNYEGGHFHSGDVDIKRTRERLGGDESAAIYGKFLPVALRYLDGPAYVWFSDSQTFAVFAALQENACAVSAVLIWHKTNATYAAMGSQYKRRHEPCVYFKPKGSTLKWIGASTESTLWEEKRDSQNTMHPTQKPVCLAERAIQNHDALTVIDLFGGSGSTLIAAEKTGRHGRLMEIEALYVDVIVRRWQAFTGKAATLDGDGRTFDEIATERRQ